MSVDPNASLEAPVDGLVYGRGDYSWQPVPEEAPSTADTIYGRSEGAWVALTARRSG
jgi:hypothetical protein